MNPLQRIADLEAQVASLTAENLGLKSRSNGNGYVDLNKLLNDIGARIDRAGQIMREDFTGKLAGLIAPYIDTTLRRCAELEAKQEELEKIFEQHRKAVAGAAAELEVAFVKMRKEAGKDWKQHRDMMHEDFGQMNGFAQWFLQEMEKNVRAQNAAAINCNSAVSACESLTKTMAVPVEQALKRLRMIGDRGEEDINRAAQHLRDTYQRLREPVLKRVTALLAVSLVVFLSVSVFTMWSVRRALNTDWQEMSEHSEQQKQEVKDLLDKTLEEVKEAQIERESKVKLWDAFMKTLTPQQRQAIVGRVREQVGDAERKRIDAQMSASYEQMNGTR
jgi:CHASE3 domain sensor protein